MSTPTQSSTTTYVFRTVNLRITIDELTEIAVKLNTWDKLWNAIGYLSTWAAGSSRYLTVDIHRDGDTDLVAVYRDADGKITYTIGAVWHGAHYGFHS